MMMRLRLLFVSLTWCVMAVASSDPAQGQCLLCDTSGGAASATLPVEANGERPLRVEVTANLDFARLVAGAGGGSIAIAPGGSTESGSGDVVALGGLGFSGRVRVEGTPGRAIRIDLPREIALTSATGAVARVTGITTGLPPLVRIGPDGRLEFGFGGRLELSGSADGEFRGRIPVTVSYD
jgi:hypothetical protein